MKTINLLLCNFVRFDALANFTKITITPLSKNHNATVLPPTPRGEVTPVQGNREIPQALTVLHNSTRLSSIKMSKKKIHQLRFFQHPVAQFSVTYLNDVLENITNIVKLLQQQNASLARVEENRDKIPTAIPTQIKVARQNQQTGHKKFPPAH